MRQLCQLLFLVPLVVVIYLSVRTSPAISRVPAFPKGLAAWFDRHDNLKNFAGFGWLAFVASVGFSQRQNTVIEADGQAPPTGQEQLQSRGASSLAVFLAACARAEVASWFRADGQVLSFLLVLVAALELAQVWIPNRVCDWRDVLCGWGGVAGAWGAFQVVRVLRVRSRCGRGSG